MMGKFRSTNHTDKQGNPTGGSATGTGITIYWQDGPLGQGEERAEPNGAFVETVIAIAKRRLEHFQKSKFSCVDNQIAIEHLKDALNALNRRTERRIADGVEGTHKVDKEQTP